MWLFKLGPYHDQKKKKKLRKIKSRLMDVIMLIILGKICRVSKITHGILI